MDGFARGACFRSGLLCRSCMLPLAVRELDAAANDRFANSLRNLLNEVGVLWFPTGGGKTESYLGLIATAMIYDRLRGKT